MKSFWYYLDRIVDRCRYIIPDSLFVRLRFRTQVGYWPDLTNPKTFNEKLNWLKLNDHRPEYTMMTDKYEVKRFIGGIIGQQYIIPTLGIWEKPEDIDWETLPEQFVLKTTNGGGSNGVIICHNKSKLDKHKTIKILNCGMNNNVYWKFREWQYKNIHCRIIAEKLLVSDMAGTSHKNNVPDYKFFCFSGSVRFFKVDFDRFTDHHANYYTPECELLPFGEAAISPNPEKEIAFPSNLQDMITLAERISNGHRFLRVDMYNVDGVIFFGETTFYPASGFGRFTSYEWDKTLGSYIDLNNVGEQIS